MSARLAVFALPGKAEEHIAQRHDCPHTLKHEERNRLEQNRVPDEECAACEVECVLGKRLPVEHTKLIENEGNEQEARTKYSYDERCIHSAGGRTCTFDLGFMSPML